MHPTYFLILGIVSAMLSVVAFAHVNRPTTWGNVITQFLAIGVCIVMAFLTVVFAGAFLGSLWVLITHNVSEPDALIMGAGLAPIVRPNIYKTLRTYSVALPDGRTYSARFIRTESRASYASSNQRNRIRVHYRIEEEGFNPYDRYEQSRQFSHGFMFGHLTAAWRRWSVVCKAMSLMLELDASTRMAATDLLPHATKRAFQIPA